MTNTFKLFLNRIGANFNKITATLFLRAIGLGVLWNSFPWWFFVLVSVVIFIRSQNWPHSLMGFYFLVVLLTYIADIWLNFGIENTDLAESSFMLRIGFAVFFSFLFLLLLGIKELFFIKRREICLVAITLAFLLISFFSFWYLEPGILILEALPFLLASIILSISFLKFLEKDTAPFGIFIHSLIISFVMTELLWVMLYASLGIANSTILLTITFFIVNSFSYPFESKNLEI